MGSSCATGTMMDDVMNSTEAPGPTGAETVTLLIMATTVKAAKAANTEISFIEIFPV
jgi:hypothetical protein